jgi:hypothetical protein
VTATLGGVYTAKAPLGVIVPPVAVQLYVNVSPSASVAAALKLLTSSDVIIAGIADGPTVNTGAEFGRGLTVIITVPVALPPNPSDTTTETITVVGTVTTIGV